MGRLAGFTYRDIIRKLKTLKAMTESYVSLNLDEELLALINDIYTDSRYPSAIGLLPKGKPIPETALLFFSFTAEILEKAVSCLQDSDADRLKISQHSISGLYQYAETQISNRFPRYNCGHRVGRSPYL
ncbi:MAG TPA: hypothetical protein P5123_08475 [Spirochaetota bacterium]|nr:hypothetical protein [Spirochaetota bacterium]